MFVTVFDENSEFVDEEKQKSISEMYCHTWSSCFQEKSFQNLFKSVRRLHACIEYESETNNVYD